MFPDIGKTKQQNERSRGSVASRTRGVVTQQFGQLEQFLYFFNGAEYTSESNILIKKQFGNPIIDLSREY